MFRPDACDGGDGAGRVAKVTPSLISELQSFNQKMNFAISYRPDPEIFGEPDIWTIAVAAGDCEDIALAKREALLRAGWPADALWLAIGQTPSGASHAVLVLRSDRGDLVLDNRSDRVEFWYRSDLRFLARQMPGDRLYWRRLRSAH
jgi:predicted transglutaminase-like cysteine proteinase